MKATAFSSRMPTGLCSICVCPSRSNRRVSFDWNYVTISSRARGCCGRLMVMPSYSEIAESLTKHLHLSQPPVAVSMTSTLPPGVAMWEGHSPAGCRFWQEAGDRVFATSAADHSLCSIGQYTHNLEMSPASQTDLMDALKVLGDLTYVREQD